MTVVSRVQERFQREVLPHLPSQAVFLVFGVSGWREGLTSPDPILEEAEQFKMGAEQKK
jgi:hypothetical protein